MENKQIIKDLTISVNRIKKARYTKHKQYQHYLQEVDTITILNTEFTKEQLQKIHQAYNIINQAKLRIANAKPATSKSEKKKGKQQPLPTSEEITNLEDNYETEYYTPLDITDVLDQEDIDNLNNNQIYTGINLITINPITKPNLGIQFQDKWYNTITELENILEPDTTYNLQYITDYDSDTQQTEKYYIIKEVK